MNFTALIPNIFYADIQVGLDLFVNCLGFKITYDDRASESRPFCVAAKDQMKIQIIQDVEFAAKDRPEFRLETENIEEVYEQISSSHPQLLHPNLSKIKLRPWGAREFALLDSSGLCVVVVEWVR